MDYTSEFIFYYCINYKASLVGTHGTYMNEEVNNYVLDRRAERTRDVHCQ